MDIQEIADSLQPFTPVIQWGAVSQKWHVTFADWKDDVYTGDTILLALQAAQQSVQPTLLESPRSGSHSCTCALCKGSHTTLPQSG